MVSLGLIVPTMSIVHHGKEDDLLTTCFLSKRRNYMGQVRPLYGYYRYCADPGGRCPGLIGGKETRRSGQAPRPIPPRTCLRQPKDESYQNL